MQILVSRMIEKIKNPYIIYEWSTKKVKYANDVAKNYVGDKQKNIDISKVFDNLQIFEYPLEQSKNISVPIQLVDVGINRLLSNDKMIVDVYTGYFEIDEDLVFIEIDPKYNFRKTFEALQELSDDILFFVEIESRSIVLRGEIGGKIDIAPSVDNYPISLVQAGIIHRDDVEHYLENANLTLQGEQNDSEFRVKMIDGSYNWFSKTSIIVFDDHGKPIKVLGKLKNIQEQKDLEFKLTHDLLSKTYNKISFINLVKAQLNSSSSGVKHAFYFIDIDDFKKINNDYGRDFGDYIIKDIGNTLIKCVRGKDFVARLGVDEFVIFVSNIKDDAIVIDKAEYIISQISREFSNDDFTHVVSVSLGIAIYPIHGKTYNELQKKADIALYNSKNMGRNKIIVYSDDLEYK